MTNLNILLEAGLTAGAAGQAKHEANDGKCMELGWVCVPMVVEAYGAWGAEAMESLSHGGIKGRSKLKGVRSYIQGKGFTYRGQGIMYRGQGIAYRGRGVMYRGQVGYENRAKSIYSQG